jgi:hypothetical protein
MAAAHAQPDQSAELLHGLLKRARRRAYTARIGPLAVACMQTARRLDPKLLADIQRLAEQLVPPASNEAAEALAGADELLVDLLRANPPRTEAEAAASIRALSRVGGASALRLISDLVAERGLPPRRWPVEEEVLSAWRLFEPEQYVSEVLARSWPAERELRVPDPAFLRALRLFPGLRAIRCELRGVTGALPAFVPSQELHRVTFTGCGEDLGLGPLLELPTLDNLWLSAPAGLPRLTALSAMSKEWALTLESPVGAERLPDLSGLNTLTALHLRGYDNVRNLGELPARPPALTELSLYGFPHLAGLDGIERWNGLLSIGFFDCPRVASFAPLASLTSLERVSLGLFGVGAPDLSPLRSLPRIRELALHGHSEFDLSTLSGARDLVVIVPPGARVTGADQLGPTCRISEIAGSQ